MEPAVKNYNLSLPFPMYEDVRSIAREKKTSVLEILRKCILIGVLVIMATKCPDTHFLIREGKREREIIFT